MKDIKYFQDIIKEKRKNTDFREFLKEIPSWLPLTFHKYDGFITRYPDTGRVKVINYKDFLENRDDLIKNGINYDFTEDFFDNFSKLRGNTGLPNSLVYLENENSNYADPVFGAKNAYLSFVIGDNAENILYSCMVYTNCSNILDSILVTKSENIYNSLLVFGGYNIFYSKFIYDSNNIWFSTNLTGCSECIFCDDLENQKYCIENQKLNKEEYFKEKEKILNNKKEYVSYKNDLSNIGVNKGTINGKGNAILFSEDIENGYMISRIKKGRNIMFSQGVDNSSNFYDCFDVGINSNNFYGVLGAGINCDNIYCSLQQGENINIYYSYFLESCSYCVGCIGLQNKSYCILNKQYTKEEWEKLATQIFGQMENDGTLGDFFPGELNPFYFNDTVAGLIGGFTKEEVEKDGYMWRDEEIKVDIPEGVEVITTNDLDKFEGYDENGNWKINPEILKVVIVDGKGNYYRIVQMEYDFLVKYGLPLPRIHWLDRIKLGFGV